MLRVVWTTCLVLAAMTTAIGFELYGDGAPPGLSYGLVVGGVLLPVLASQVVQRIIASPQREV